jgi:hypothetical protein
MPVRPASIRQTCFSIAIDFITIDDAVKALFGGVRTANPGHTNV